MQPAWSLVSLHIFTKLRLVPDLLYPCFIVTLFAIHLKTKFTWKIHEKQRLFFSQTQVSDKLTFFLTNRWKCLTETSDFISFLFRHLIVPKKVSYRGTAWSWYNVHNNLNKKVCFNKLVRFRLGHSRKDAVSTTAEIHAIIFVAPGIYGAQIETQARVYKIKKAVHEVNASVPLSRNPSTQ